MNLAETNAHDGYQFMQMSATLYDTPPMDHLLYDDEFEIAKEMGTPGVIWMQYVLEDSPFSSAL